MRFRWKGCLLAWAAGCLVTLASAGSIARLELIGSCVVPEEGPDGTRTLGLSGIDYDARQDRWIVVSDVGRESKASFFTLRVDYTATEVRGATIESAGNFAPAPGDDPRFQPDLESVRYDADGTLWYTSESGGVDPQARRRPLVRHARADGSWLGELPLDGWVQPPSAEKGPGFNGSLEGMTFDRARDTLWLAMEQPFHEDGGLPAQPEDPLPPVRVTQVARDGRVLSQYAYRVNPMPGREAFLHAHPLAPGKEARDLEWGEGNNGVSEILAAGNGEFLVAERFGYGIPRAGEHWDYLIKIYLAGTAGATDVRGFASLKPPAAFTAMPKQLLFDFAGEKEPGCVEGLTWGREVDGAKTLVMVTDNHRGGVHRTFLWVFRVVPGIDGGG